MTRACLDAKLLLPVRPSRASCATCTDIFALPPTLAPTHRYPHWSSSALQPSAETSVSIAFASLCSPFPCKVCPSRVSHFKGAVQGRSQEKKRPLRLECFLLHSPNDQARSVLICRAIC